MRAKPNPKRFELPSRTTYKLDAMRSAVRLLDHPELGRKTILVAGTNGKGSVVAMLTHFFCELGWKVGTFISPHLIHPNERIRIQNEPVSNLSLGRLRRKYARELAPLTFFERWTALAFLHFREQQVDLQILEVGMGGRLDATNVSDPDLSVITHIDFDHQEVLGRTLRKIAREKAGIMRRGRPVILAPQAREAKASLLQEARRMGAKTIFAGPQKRVAGTLLKALARQRGRHQQENAAAVVSCLEAASRLWNFKISSETLRRALQKPLYGARIQVVSRKPLWMIDGAHNEDSVRRLVQYLNEHHSPLRGRFLMIFGAMKEKDAGKLVSLLRPWVQEVYLPSFYRVRETPPKDLLPLFSQARTFRTVRAALAEAKRQKRPTLVVGSLYLAGRSLEILGKKKGI